MAEPSHSTSGMPSGVVLEALSLAELREKTRRLFALCFCETKPPKFLERVSNELHATLESVTALVSVVEAQGPDLRDLHLLTSGLWDFLDHLQEGLSPWIDTPFKLAGISTSQHLELRRAVVLPELDLDEAALSCHALLFETLVHVIKLSQGSHETDNLPAVGGHDGARRLRAIVGNFIAGCPDLSPPPSPRLIPCETCPDVDDRQQYGDIIGKHLKLSMKEAFGKAPAGDVALSRMLHAAVYWSQRASKGLALLRSSSTDLADVVDVELSAAQAFLDTIKAAILLDTCHTLKPELPSLGLVFRVIDELIDVVLGYLERFYRHVFSIPSYAVLLHQCDHTLSAPFLGNRRSRTKSTSSSKSPQGLLVRTEPLLAGWHQGSTSSAASAGRSPTAERSRAESSASSDIPCMEKRGGAPIPGALPWAVELRPAPSTLSMLPRIGNSSPMAAPRGSREDDVELSEPRVSANFASEGRLRSQGLEDTLVVATMRGSNPDKEVVTTPLEVPPASHPGNNPASVVVGDRPRRTPPGLDGSQLSHLQTEDHSHDKESSDLHVTMKEQALIRANIEAVEAADDEVEVFDENAESAPSNFYRGILSLGRAQHASKSSFVPSKPINDHRLQSSSEFVPLYAFVDDTNEVAEIYFRHNGQQVGFKYQFTIGPRGSSTLHGFQGAVLDMTFEEEYHIAEISFNKSVIEKDQVLRFPRLQLWSDRSHESTRPNQGSIRSSGSSIAARDVSLQNLDILKNSLDCSRLFVYTKTPKMSIYMLFIDDRVVIHHPSSTGFFSSKSQQQSLVLLPDKSKGISRLRLREIGGNAPGIPLNMEGLQYRDQDGPRFTDCKSIQLGFHSEAHGKAFEATFGELKKDWEKKLRPAHKVKRYQRQPHIRVVTT